MRATRLRLRFVPGVSLPASTYGSGLYGSQTYGQKATDPLAALEYRLVPLPAGYLADPAWIYREGDISPKFQAQVIGDDDVPLDLSALGTGALMLTPIDGRDYDAPTAFDLVWPTPANGTVERTWQPADLTVPGVYRATVILVYQSSRRLTVHGDDRHHFIINAR
jgi:hypothetical protein